MSEEGRADITVIGSKFQVFMAKDSHEAFKDTVSCLISQIEEITEEKDEEKKSKESDKKKKKPVVEGGWPRQGVVDLLQSYMMVDID